MRTKFQSLTLITIALLAGCARVMTPSTLTRSSPANPGAPEAIYSRDMPVLMRGTNDALRPQVEKEESAHHEHGSTGQAPSKAHGEHEHEIPKQ